MTAVLDLFTKPFTMPDCTERRALVERVPEFAPEAFAMRHVTLVPGWPSVDRTALKEMAVESLLIRAAHEWAGEHVWVAEGRGAVSEIKDFGLYPKNVSSLVRCCHLIADAQGVP